MVERAGVAYAASGNAGGFLALDWNDSTAVGPLARLSYKLHEGLESELGRDLDYRCVADALPEKKSSCASVYVVECFACCLDTSCDCCHTILDAHAACIDTSSVFAMYRFELVRLVCRKLDTFSVEAWHQGGLLHSNRGHKKLPAWIDGHIVNVGVCLFGLELLHVTQGQGFVSNEH